MPFMLQNDFKKINMEAEQNQEDPLDSFEVTKSIYPRMAMCLNSAAISIQDCAE